MKSSKSILLTLSLFISGGLLVQAAGLSTAYAQTDDSGDFTRGDLGAPPNTDSESVPGLAMQVPSYSGTGCPNGTASATLTQDGRTLSVLFDSYIAEAGTQAGAARAAKNCQLNIPFQVPEGYAVEIVKMDYRGFASLPQGARSTFGAGFRLLEVDGRTVNARRVMRASVMQGPREENFVFTSMMMRGHFSPCGRDFTLAAESILNVQTNRAGDQATATVDSLDAIQTPVVYSLRWVKCENGQRHGGSGMRPDRPGRPGRPGRR